MLKFLGYELELLVEEVMVRFDGPAVCSAVDSVGGRWLIVEVDDDPQHLAWMCAPTSDRAVRAVRDRQAAAVDVLRHSATGTVTLVAIERGVPVPDRCLLCEEVAQGSTALRRNGGGLAA